jgi:hypothetical protein
MGRAPRRLSRSEADGGTARSALFIASSGTIEIDQSVIAAATYADTLC